METFRPHAMFVSRGQSVLYRAASTSGRLWLHLVFTFLVLLQLCSASNQFYSFSNCDKPRDNVFVVEGAVVTSQAPGDALSNALNCTYMLQAAPPFRHLLLRFDTLDISRDQRGRCIDHLSIYDITARRSILHRFCGELDDRPGAAGGGVLRTEGAILQVTWVTGRLTSRDHSMAFSVTVTAYGTDAAPCASPLLYQCLPSPGVGPCVSSALRCDGVVHCPEGEDETGCRAGGELLRGGQAPYPLQVESLTAVTEQVVVSGQHSTQRSPPVSPTSFRTPPLTTQSATQDPPPFTGTSFYMWLPIVVVFIFTVVMVSLIIIGRRARVATASIAAPSLSNSNLTTNLTTSTLTTKTTTPGIIYTTTHSTPRILVTLDPDSDLGYTGSELIYMVVLFTIFIVIIVACILFAKKDARGEESSETQALGSCTEARNGLSVTIPETHGDYEPGPDQPSTPPPSYSILERQISYVSHISQSSSQIEEPPDYIDALDFPGGGSGRWSGSRNASGFRDRRRSGSAGPSRMERFRNRIFSRSISANTESNERYRRRNGSSSSTEPPEGIPEEDRLNASTTDVFSDPPAHHSTPEDSAPAPTSAHNGHAPVLALESAVTAAGCEGGAEGVSGSTPSIFDHIHHLNDIPELAGAALGGVSAAGGGGVVGEDSETRGPGAPDRDREMTRMTTADDDSSLGASRDDAHVHQVALLSGETHQS